MDIEYNVTIKSDGSQEWRYNGQLHREDGPALTTKSGDEISYYRKGKLHRPYKDGPAKLGKGGWEYYQNGILHNPDGYAVFKYNGPKEYWIDGKLLTKEEFYAIPPVLA